MPTAYLSPSQLQDLTNVSSTAPGSGDNGKALVWNQTAGKWQAQQVAYANLSGAPALPIPVASGGTGTQTGSITGTEALAFTAATNSNLSLNFSGTGNFLLNQGATNRFGVKSYGIIHFFGEPIEDLNLPFQIRAENQIGYLSVNDGSQYALLIGYDNQNPTYQGVVIRNVKSGSGETINFVVRNTNIAAKIFGDRSIELYGSLAVAGPTLFSTTTSSTSTTTGALRVSGGVGIAGNLNVGGSKVNFANLPTSDASIAVGDLWRDGNVIKVKT
jgi:hypothetical protein